MRIGVHHYVGRLLDYFESEDYFYMILEEELGGTLEQYITDRKNYISE
jgi:serine/threonine protein kinase